jgi:type I restriction enzyme M protein
MLRSGAARKPLGRSFENVQFDIKHDEVLGRALLSLDRINFAGMAYDQKGDVYEFLIAKMADAGVKGEAFTPRPIVNMIIDVLRPRMELRVWDPACGTGGLLSRAFEQMLADLRHRYSEGSRQYIEGLDTLRTSLIYGNETEAVSARLARMNMILRGDGHSTILEFNSLDQQTYTQKRLEIRGVKENNPIPAVLEDGGFDLIMANPPYGGSQAVSDVGSSLKPWHKSKKPEANFLQVMMAALKPGGMCGVLMPEGILFRREEKKI